MITLSSMTLTLNCNIKHDFYIECNLYTLHNLYSTPMYNHLSMYCHVNCNPLQHTPTLPCIVYVACNVLYDLWCMYNLYTLYKYNYHHHQMTYLKGANSIVINTPS
ncbi:hypothetical protein Syun_013648 [Stephania yunnanensis]|uniref:Uncharacterized protein n=1 Tax=Stephania yunnanensis TaxID=152371 RepID=A0AAP0P7X9_9MAGN